jgi:hypothetical protein
MVMEIKTGSDLAPDELLLIEQPFLGHYHIASPETPDKDRQTFAARVVSVREHNAGGFCASYAVTCRVVDNGFNLHVEIGSEFTTTVGKHATLCKANTGWRHAEFERKAAKDLVNGRA